MNEQRKSSWDDTVAKSKYHFDTTIKDPRWDSAVGLGHITPCWTDELKEIISTAKPATWATRGYKGEGVEAPPDALAAEEYDIARVGADPKAVITHLNWRIPPVLEKISDLFALTDVMNRIHVQMPGELWHLHIDKLQKWCPEDPSKVMRIFVQLTDWRPGQFWEYGNFHHNQWRAGDVVTFDWQNIPHSTANAGHHPRVTFQITGVKTDATDKFLAELKQTTSYSL
jgi:hypothetical protein